MSTDWFVNTNFVLAKRSLAHGFVWNSKAWTYSPSASRWKMKTIMRKISRNQCPKMTACDGSYVQTLHTAKFNHSEAVAGAYFAEHAMYVVAHSLLREL
jgi:hypothetical protein